MNINEIAKDIHNNAVAHGWWEDERTVGDVIALCHSELSEALEEHRNGKPMLYCNYCDSPAINCAYCPHLKSGKEKPEGIAVEMVDCVIRIFDYLEKEGVDIENVMEIKHKYNKSRSYRHGGKLL